MKRLLFLLACVFALPYAYADSSAESITPEDSLSSLAIEDQLPEMDPAERIRRECCIRKLESHVLRQSENSSFNTIRVELEITKDQQLDGVNMAAWIELIRFALASCQAAAFEPWITRCKVDIKEPSNSAVAHFNFGNDQMGIQGAIELTLGASDCCPDCYPMCCCKPRSDGSCPCTPAMPHD
jgi:hypothetical protein